MGQSTWGLARFPLSCLHVRTNQLTKMFWGLIVEPGRKYSQTVENSFHISKATVDLSSVTDEDITLLLDYEGQQEHILCHLNKRVWTSTSRLAMSSLCLPREKARSTSPDISSEKRKRMKTKSVKKRRRKKSLKPRATSDRCLSTDKPCLKRRNRPSPKTRRKRKGNSNRRRRLPLRR